MEQIPLFNKVGTFSISHSVMKAVSGFSLFVFDTQLRAHVNIIVQSSASMKMCVEPPYMTLKLLIVENQ